MMDTVVHLLVETLRGPKTTMQDPRVLHGDSRVRQRLARNSVDFFLTREDRFLICQNGLLIGENFIQRLLVLQDRGLILEKSFLIFQNGSLMAEDCFLIRYHFVF